MDGRGLRITYMPALDGVRGLAVAGVLAYHGGLNWAGGGFLGVDAFLVLSGYLITALLITEGDARGGIALRAFWMRRARRLLPALFVLIAGVAAYGALLAEPYELPGIRADALATLAYVANWQQVLTGDSYFEQFGTPSPLLHTWSLAIEEQWYVVWPLALALAVRARARPHMLLALCIALTLASAALMALLRAPGEDPSRVYYGTDTRAQSLLVGAALALALSMPRVTAALSRWRLAVQGAAIAAAAVLAWAWHDATGSTDILYRGGFLALALCVATIIAATIADAGGPVARALRAPLLRWTGVISYGIYLYHWPLFLVLTPERTGLDGYALFAVRCAVTVAIAAVSYWLIEDPIRRGRIASRMPGRVAIPGAAAAAAAVIVAVMVTTQGATELGAPPADASAAPPAARDTTRVLVVGDSVAFTLGAASSAPPPRSGSRSGTRGASAADSCAATPSSSMAAGPRHRPTAPTGSSAGVRTSTRSSRISPSCCPGPGISTTATWGGAASPSARPNRMHSPPASSRRRSASCRRAVRA